VVGATGFFVAVGTGAGLRVEVEAPVLRSNLRLSASRA
jgi:hypothetical protein